MFRAHRVRVTLCTAIALAGLALLQPPAHAALADGKAAAGAGGGSCSLTISCGRFENTCDMTANDIDASVRSVNVNEPHAVTYSATLVPPALGKLVVVGFGANCKPNMLPFYAVSGQGVPFPFGTRYVAAWPADRFAQMTWQLH